MCVSLSQTMHYLICHGVPSPKLLETYIGVRRGEGNVKDISFRDKTEGWKLFSMFVGYEKGDEYRRTLREDLYLRAFLRNICLRSSCYQCAFKTKERQSDITLADYWGIEKIHPEMDDDKGTSLVFVNSAKGKRIFEEISKNLIYCETDKEKAIENNSAMIKSVVKPKNREKYLRKLRMNNFEKLTKKYIRPSLYKRIEWKLKEIGKRIIKGEK